MGAEERENSEVFKKIQEVEAHVEELVNEAIADAGERVRKARELAVKVFNDKCREVDKECAKTLEKEFIEAEKSAELMIAAARNESDALKAEAKTRLDDAARFILNKVYPDLPKDNSQ